MIKQIYGALKATYNEINNYDNIDPNLIRYFKTEYGKNWEQAMSQYLYEKKIKNDKKAA